MGFSAYENATPVQGVSKESEEQIREALGGQIQLLPTTQTRWYLADLETAQLQADSGQMHKVGQLWRAMKRDGYIGGLVKTRTSGLVALQKRFRGDKALTDELTGQNDSRSVFDEMFPPAELAALAADGIGCGIGVAEMVAVPGRDHPVMVRLDPEFLWYRWNEGRWYFQSTAGLIPITPGDGRWILHVPGGRLQPWQSALWPCLGHAFIVKDHAKLHRANFSAKLANPARVAFTPQGASEDAKLSFFQRLMAWGLNSVFSLPSGWDVKLLESNGKGWEVFGTEIDTSNFEIMIALAGQVVTVTGGTGFANASIHQTIRADLIKETAESLAHTINTQGLPPWAFKRKGLDVLPNCPRVEWDIAPPADRKADADAIAAVAAAITTMRPVLAAGGVTLDVDALISRFGIPTTPGAPPTITEPAIETKSPAGDTPPDTDKGSPDGAA
jgi:hypothetical protein